MFWTQVCLRELCYLCKYTNKGQCYSRDLSLIKYADDMALVSCQQDLTREMCFGGSRRDGGMEQTFKPISLKGCRWNRLPTSNILEHILTIHSLIRTKLTRQWLTLLGKLRKDLMPAIALSEKNYGVFHCKLADMLKIVVSNFVCYLRMPLPANFQFM